MAGGGDGAGGVRRQELSADEHRQALPRGVHQARPRARAAGIAGGRLGRLRRRAGVSAPHARRRREGGSRAHAGAARRAARSRRRSGARSSSCTATRWATISTPARWSVSVDFEPVVNKEKDASDLHGADYRRIWGGSTPVGDHVLLVEAVHDCKPGIGRAVRALAPAQGLVVQERRARARHDPRSAPTARTARATPRRTRPSSSPCADRTCRAAHGEGHERACRVGATHR